MDFTTQRVQPRVNTPAPQQNSANAAPVRNGNDDGKRRKGFGHKWFQISSVILLFSGTILVVAVLLFINIGSPTQESKYINKSEYQAVFVNVTGTNGGQVYFGHIDNLSSSFIHLTNVFYIQNQTPSTGASSSSNSYNLVKLGCELHGPEDGMTINRNQVFFWENLKASGQVSQKIVDFYKQNPNGQKCSDTTASGSTQQSSPSSTSSTATPSTTPAATTNKP